jgi:hypothetical protein
MKIKLFLYCLPLFFLMFNIRMAGQNDKIKSFKEESIEVLSGQILKEAAWALKQKPETVTTYRSSRSAGGKNDFYSEGDYWWPDPDNPQGPYIRRDGETNPENFTAHREAMIRFSRIIGSLASAYKITGEEKYLNQALLHLNAWFIDPETKMNPSLNFAQAIKGRVTGRGIGIIDTIHLMEVAQGLRVMEEGLGVNSELVIGVKEWFSQYLNWLTTSPYGVEEMNWKNNHSICWVMQVASFSLLTNNKELLEFCRKRYKEVLLPNQMAEDGSFPLELERTKPYGYSLFNLDALTMVVHMLSDKTNDLWNYKTTGGKSIKRGIEFLFPYVIEKEKWPYQKDVMYWENWPIAHPFLLFGAEEFKKVEWMEAWKSLEHHPAVEEVIRNLPVRNPVIWFY